MVSSTCQAVTSHWPWIILPFNKECTVVCLSHWAWWGFTSYSSSPWYLHRLWSDVIRRPVWTVSTSCFQYPACLPQIIEAPYFEVLSPLRCAIGLNIALNLVSLRHHGWARWVMLAINLVCTGIHHLLLSARNWRRIHGWREMLLSEMQGASSGKMMAASWPTPRARYCWWLWNQTADKISFSLHLWEGRCACATRNLRSSQQDCGWSLLAMDYPVLSAMLLRNYSVVGAAAKG